MIIESGHISKTMGEIRANILLLAIGHEYLSKEPFIRKMGLAIDTQIEPLKREISKIRGRLPGAFYVESDPLGILKEIQERARFLMNPSSEITRQCASGDFGRELEHHLDDLTLALTNLERQGETKTPKYGIVESVFNLLTRCLPNKTILFSPVRMLLKTLIPFVLLALFAFLYLFVSMGREKDYFENIERMEVTLRSQQNMLSENRTQRERILETITDIENKKAPETVSRQAKLERIYLNMSLQKLEQERRLLEAKIETVQKTIGDDRKKIDEMRSKSFIQRLLKQ